MKRAVVIIIFTLLAILVTWPLLFHLSTSIIDRFDGLLIAWFLNWDIHCFVGGGVGLRNCFNANIFYPYHNTLAFSETMFPEALLAAPLTLLLKEPLLAYNLNFFLGFILSGLSLYSLLLQITKKHFMAVCLSIVFTFSTIHLNYMPHLQLFNLWPITFAILFIMQRKYRLFVLFFAISVLTTALNLYFLYLIVGVRLLFFPSERKKLIISTIVGSFLVLPILLPYYFVSKQFSYVRPINDAIHFSLQFPDLLNISSISRLHKLIPPTSAGTPAYFGIGIYLLLVMAIWQVFKKKIKDSSDSKFFLWIAIISFVLALGPALHLSPYTVHIGPFKGIPLPYVIPYYLLPGFSGFRTPSRWIILTALTLVAWAAMKIYSKVPSKGILFFLVVLTLAEISWPFKFSTVPSLNQFPPEQIWLKDHFDSGPIVQFPIYNWDTPGFGQETLREYYSTVHWHPMFNGFSGFSPKEWEQRVKWLQKEFPSKEAIAYLRNLKIRLILTPKSWSDRMKTYPELRLVKALPETNIYEILQ